VVRSSKDITVFWQELISFYRDMLVLKTTRNADKYLDLTDSEKETLSSLASLFTKETLLAHCRMLDDSLYAMQKSGSVKRIVAEMTLIKMSDHSLDVGADNILSRLSKLELAVASGNISVPSPVNKTAIKPTEEKSVGVVETKQQSSVALGGGEMKALRGWNEIAERAVGSDGYLLSFLKIAKGYITSDGKVVIRFKNDFAMEMIDKAGIKNTIASVIKAETKKDFSESDIIYEVSSDTDDGTADDLALFDV